MSVKNTDQKLNRLSIYDRHMLRSTFVSLFWAVISERRSKGYKLKDLAQALGRDKSTVSRWFRDRPNWRLDTIADVAGALDLQLRIDAVDRSTGVIYTATGRAPSLKRLEPEDESESSVVIPATVVVPRPSSVVAKWSRYEPEQELVG